MLRRHTPGEERVLCFYGLSDYKMILNYIIRARQPVAHDDLCCTANIIELPSIDWLLRIGALSDMLNCCARSHIWPDQVTLGEGPTVTPIPHRSFLLCPTYAKISGTSQRRGGERSLKIAHCNGVTLTSFSLLPTPHVRVATLQTHPFPGARVTPCPHCRGIPWYTGHSVN
jgi:hypothetical protein